MAFTEGQIVERSADGEAAVWGSVTRWEPPVAVAFTWHPGQPAERARQIEVTFAAAAAAQTPVRVEHTGWDAFGHPAAARAPGNPRGPAFCLPVRPVARLRLVGCAFRG